MLVSLAMRDLQAIDPAHLERVAGGDELYMRPTDNGFAVHRLTDAAKNTYNTCSDRADQSWFGIRHYRQFRCNQALAKSIQENKVADFVIR